MEIYAQRTIPTVFLPLRIDFSSIHFNNADGNPNDVCLFTRFTSDSYIR